MKDYEIIELIEKATKNDDVAFSHLIKYYENDFYRIAYSNLRNHEDVLDALQNTYFLIYKHLRKLKSKEKYKTWAIKILYNECNKIHNRRKTDYENISEFKESELNELYYFDKTDNLANQISLNSAMKLLNNEDKMMLSLKYSTRLTIKEIASIVGKPENTVKTRLRRSKEFLSNHLKKGLY